MTLTFAEIDALPVGASVDELDKEGYVSRYVRLPDLGWQVQWSSHPAWPLVQAGLLEVVPNSTAQFPTDSTYTVTAGDAVTPGILSVTGEVNLTPKPITDEDIQNAMAIDADDEMDEWSKDDE